MKIGKSLVIKVLLCLILFASLCMSQEIFADPKAEAATTQFKTSATLNLRTGASTKHKAITTIPKGKTVTYVSKSGSWYKVKYGSKTGYASSKYLKKVQAISVTTYYTTSALNMRAGASANHKVITTIPKGKAVTYVSKSGSWYKVKYGSKTGYVSSKYLTSTKPAAPKNYAEGLKTVGSNKQLILVTTNGTSTSNATIQTYEKDSKGKWKLVLSVPGYVGKYGLTSNMSEGGKKSPQGKYSIGQAFGTQSNPGTKLSYRKITSDDVWVDDSKSKLYNTWQSRKKTAGQWKSAENMNVAAYKYGFVINYNTKRVPGKGSAIFFHISSSYTLGCTGTSEANVLKIMRWLDPKKNPVIIQTPIKELSKY